MKQSFNFASSPIGIAPRYIIDDRRKTEILAAIERFVAAGVKIPQWWIDELNEILGRQEEGK